MRRSRTACVPLIQIARTAAVGGEYDRTSVGRPDWVAGRLVEREARRYVALEIDEPDVRFADGVEMRHRETPSVGRKRRPACGVINALDRKRSQRFPVEREPGQGGRTPLAPAA